MPNLGKKSLSLYLRNSCERQFVLTLYGDVERKNNNMPPRQKGRTALGFTGKAGYEYQSKRVSELQAIFGDDNILVNPAPPDKPPAPRDLMQDLPNIKPNQFIVEATFRGDTPTFRSAVGLVDIVDYYGDLVDLSEGRPDIVQVLPYDFRGVDEEVDDEKNPYLFAVQPDGTTYQLNTNDTRTKLRVIDIKLASEPGAHYFAEVVYYSMSLSAWLIDNNLDDKFVVSAVPAVWPGSHEASHIAKQLLQWKNIGHQPTDQELATALEEDLEIATVEVFGSRLRRFFNEELPALLNKPWQDLEWHVNHRCKGCEFLGYPWLDDEGNETSDPLHCLPTAKDLGHLSAVVGLSRGASEQLRRQSIDNIIKLAGTAPVSPVFDDHQGLKAKRTTYPHRANALVNSKTSVIPDSGGDALMPKWPNLHIYIFIDYDLSSAITASIALRAFWREPLPYGSALEAKKIYWTVRQGEDEVFLIDIDTIERERDEFLKFLRQLRKIINEVIQQDVADTQQCRRDKKTRCSTYQIYLWDESQRKHLVRLASRHLPYILVDPQLRSLAWLFTPPELLPEVEESGRQSPITLVSNVVDNTIAVPIPHHHRLLDVVQSYKPPKSPAYSVHPLYQEPMSDLLPAERIHEWWRRVGRWQERQALILETARKKTYALNLIVERLETDLKPVLSRQAGPPLVRSTRNVIGVAPQGRLWLEFTRLNAALNRLEKHTIRSMPVHEREARLKSARLVRLLSGIEEQTALITLSASKGQQILPASDLLVYEMNNESCELNAKPGEFLYALVPHRLHGFLDSHPYNYTKGTSLEKVVFGDSVADAQMSAVTIEAIDRLSGLIALRVSPRSCIPQLETEVGLDFSQNVTLDPIYKDFLSKKVELTVQGIGHPPEAVADQRTLEALGLPPNFPPGNSKTTPAATFLWDASRINNERTNINTSNVRTQLETLAQDHFLLDPSQWKAWEDVLSRRLSLIWGPPGTGKSRTLRAVIAGAVVNALDNHYTLRLLITANTYTAIDNVLLGIEQELKEFIPKTSFEIYRVQSEYHPLSPDLPVKHPDLKNLILNTAQPSVEIKNLINRLETPKDIIVVGCPPQQLHNLSVAGKKYKNRRPKDTIRSWFDLIIIDEASQMDVASSTLIFTKVDPFGSCVVAGDDLQLPPIQEADPPKDLENIVGSVYNYFRRHHNLIPNALDINYRSNRTLVSFTRLAGYSPNLTSYSPDLQLHLSSTIPNEKPLDWPNELFWTPHWSSLIDPNHPTTCFIYNDSISSQVNEFEADAIAAIVWLLYGRITKQLLNERRPDGSFYTKSDIPCDIEQFWDKAVGIVTPHRAQMAKIIYRLQQLFPSHSPEGIRNAVDTVERFQGQQRDIIIASFGLGDSDIISSEDEFLFNLNRFNVLTSRSRAKLIVFVTRSLLEHLSNDVDVLRESRLLKQFAEDFCTNPQMVKLGFIKKGIEESREGIVRKENRL